MSHPPPVTQRGTHFFPASLRLCERRESLLQPVRHDRKMRMCPEMQPQLVPLYGYHLPCRRLKRSPDRRSIPRELVNPFVGGDSRLDGRGGGNAPRTLHSSCNE